MNYAFYLGFCLLGFGLAAAIFYLLGAKRRAWIPRLPWWLYFLLGSVPGLYGLSHSTIPSFSTPTTAVGKAYYYVNRESHTRHGTDHGAFRFLPEGGEAINIETEIILPDWGSPPDFNGRTFRVAYLKDGTYRFLKNEAVDITILSGKHTGFHGSRDARLFGSWLGLPIGAALIALGYLLFYYGKDDPESAASDKHDNPSI
jgi:hypothetical protein